MGSNLCFDKSYCTGNTVGAFQTRIELSDPEIRNGELGHFDCVQGSAVSGSSLFRRPRT